MTVLVRVRRLVAIAIPPVVLCVLSAGCGSSLSGSAVAASAIAAPPTAVISGGSPTARPSSSATATTTIGTVPSTEPSPSAGRSPSAGGDVASGAWSAVVETGPGNGIPSPNGDLSVQFDRDQVCFVPVSGTRRCGPLAAGASATFAAFSQDGANLLVVAGAAAAAGVYVFRASDSTARVLGPTGVQDFAAGATPPEWELSSAAWGADGRSVLLVPITKDASGPVLQFDLTSGKAAERLRLDAALANSSPSLWTTQTGLAIVPAVGEQRNTLWWFDFAAGSARRIAVPPEPDRTITLSSADPLGRFVLICSRRSNGAFDALAMVAVDQSRNVRLLPDATSCAGSVSSPDGAHLAVTTEVAGAYSLVVVGVENPGTELTVPLSVSNPSAPPYLTWHGDVIVAADVSGAWPVPSIVVRLKR